MWKSFPSGQSPGREMQEENQESPQQILLLNSLGQTASVLPGPWCPWCGAAQELHGNAKFNTEDHNGREALEVFFFSLKACLTAWPFPECLCSGVSLQGSTAPDLHFSQKSWGSAGFPALTAAHISWRCSLTLWTFIYCSDIGRPCWGKSHLLHMFTWRPQQGWRNSDDLILSLCFRMHSSSSRMIDLFYFFFLTVTSSKCESWRN